jgi:hypothetical protein
MTPCRFKGRPFAGMPFDDSLSWRHAFLMARRDPGASSANRLYGRSFLNGR